VYLETHCNMGSKRAFPTGVLYRWHNCLLIYWRTNCLVPAIVVAVVRGEHPTVTVAECIKAASVTRVPSHLQPVPVCLGLHLERTVLGPVPVVGVATWLQVEPQLIAAGQRQLTEPIVTDPVVVTTRVAETDFVLRPRTIKVAGPVEMLLDQ